MTESVSSPRNPGNDQRSLSDQLDTLRVLARLNGLYDAEDWLVRTRN